MKIFRIVSSGGGTYYVLTKKIETAMVLAIEEADKPRPGILRADDGPSTVIEAEELDGKVVIDPEVIS